METKIKHYSELSKDEFHDIIALRISVFVVEQDCPYQELDGLDKDAFHLLVVEDDKIIGTSRLLKPGVVYDEWAVGRVVSAIDQRNKRLGHQMMKAIMKYLNGQPVRLSAQTHLTRFYESYGFKSTGKEYLEDGIPHTEMLFKGTESKI